GGSIPPAATNLFRHLHDTRVLPVGAQRAVRLCRLAVCRARALGMASGRTGHRAWLILARRLVLSYHHLVLTHWRWEPVVGGGGPPRMSLTRPRPPFWAREKRAFCSAKATANCHSKLCEPISLLP